MNTKERKAFMKRMQMKELGIEDSTAQAPETVVDRTAEKANTIWNQIMAKTGTIPTDILNRK